MTLEPQIGKNSDFLDSYLNQDLRTNLLLQKHVAGAAGCSQSIIALEHELGARPNSNVNPASYSGNGDRLNLIGAQCENGLFSSSLSDLFSRKYRYLSVGSHEFWCRPVFALRALKDEVEELKELAKERDCYYASESREMQGFRAQREGYVAGCRRELAQLRGQASKLKSNFSKLQTGISYSNNPEIDASEMKKCRLLSEKENIDLLLSSNISTRDRLRKQLRMILADQNHHSSYLCLMFFRSGLSCTW